MTVRSWPPPIRATSRSVSSWASADPTNPTRRSSGRWASTTVTADAASRLNPGGALYLVIRKQQGAESCMKYLKTLYAKVDKVDKSGGFWVLRATEPLKKENEAQEEAADAHV